MPIMSAQPTAQSTAQAADISVFKDGDGDAHISLAYGDLLFDVAVSQAGRVAWAFKNGLENQHKTEHVDRVPAQAQAVPSPSPLPAVAEGWRLVPVKPTQEFWDAVWKEITKDSHVKGSASIAQIKRLLDVCWQALLSSAPQAPQSDPDIEAAQWRNIKKVIKALADFCFGSKDNPKYGHCHLALTNSLTAKDGLDVSKLGLEPLHAPQAPASPWRPIEEAPRDGTHVLLTNGADVAEGFWFEDPDRTRESCYSGDPDFEGSEGWMDIGGGMQPDPTHYMPLPAPFAEGGV